MKQRGYRLIATAIIAGSSAITLGLMVNVVGDTAIELVAGFLLVAAIAAFVVDYIVSWTDSSSDHPRSPDE